MNAVRSLSRVEAAERAALLTVHRYDVELDLTGLREGDVLRATSTIRFAAADVGATEAPTNPGSGLITFNVPPDAAQRIALAGTNLYMTLAPKDYQPVDVPPVDYSNLVQPGVLSPYPAGG